MSLSSQKLTLKLIKALVSRQNDYFIWDSEVTGLGIRIWPSGKRTFVFRYKDRMGRSKRITLGAFGQLTLEQAKTLANKNAFEIHQGDDPMQKKKFYRDAETVAQFCVLYIEQYAKIHKKPKSVIGDQSMIRNNIIPNIGTEKVCSLDHVVIAKLHLSMREHPYIANRTIALLSKMMNLAEDWGIRPDNSNPCRKIRKFKEFSRERFLDVDELKRLGNALNKAEKEGNHILTAIHAIRLLILTGCRKSEILNLKWSYIDYEYRCLRLPDSKTGAKIVPVGDVVLTYLMNINKEEDNEYVIASHFPKENLKCIKKAWEMVRREAALGDLRLHDLRHTFASFGVAENFALPLIGNLLGHTQASTTQRYAHVALNPASAAATQISNKILGALMDRGANQIDVTSQSIFKE